METGTFLEYNCIPGVVVSDNLPATFTCGDSDLDEFFLNDCLNYSRQLLGKTYYYALKEDQRRIVCAFTLSNAGLRSSDLPNARRKKIEANIPHLKTMRDYPAVLIGRLGVATEFQSRNVGTEVIDFVKGWFSNFSNKTGCRFVIVDAYNNAPALAFYERNGFRCVFSSDEQERIYRQLSPDATLNSRLMYFDLASINIDNN